MSRALDASAPRRPHRDVDFDQPSMAAQDLRADPRGLDDYAPEQTAAQASILAAEEPPARVETPPPAPRGPDITRGDVAGPGGVWGWATFASVVWVGGVVAFSFGMLSVPTGSSEAMSARLAEIDTRIFLAIAGVAVGPLGLIWLTAVVARRARALRADVESVRESALQIADLLRAMARSGVSGGGGAGAGGAMIAAQAELSGFEQSLERLEAVAHSLRAQIEADGAQLERALTSGGADANAEARAQAFAAMVARALPGSAPRGAQSPAPASAATSRPAPTAQPAPSQPAPSHASARPTAGRGAAPESAREAVLRAADAAAAKTGAKPAAANGAPRPAAKPAPAQRTAPTGPSLRVVDPGPDAAGDAPQGQIEELRRQIGRGRDEPGQPTARTGAEGGGDLEWEKLVRAANFPDSEDDRETLEALYSVLTDKDAAALLQAAEDALSTLADLDLFMEDMRPHHASVDAWRSFIVDGDERDAMALGGVRDPHAIEDAQDALDGKPDFSVAAAKFIDRYESMLRRLFGSNADPELAIQMADTRTGRAYMLLARASGRLG